MRAQIVSIALLGLVAVASAKDCYGYYGIFNNCFEHSSDLCAGTDTCGEHEQTSAAPGSEPSTSLFTSVAPGYTPSPGECVCVSAASTSASEVSTGAPQGQTTAAASGSSNAPAIVCPCELVSAFYNVSVLLEGTEYYEIFIEWIYEIEITILSNSSFTEQEKLIEIVYSLEVLFAQYEFIEETIQYEAIAGFGYFCDLFTVVIDIQASISITKELIVLDSEGNCALFEALLNASYESSAQYEAIFALIEKIRVDILEIESYTYEDKCILLYEYFLAFFQQNSEWESFFFSIQIEGFGCFEQYFQQCLAYYRLYTVQFVIGGSTDDCVLLKAILAQANNQSLDISVRQQLNQFYQELVVLFESTTDVYARLDVFANCSFEFYELEPWIISVFYSIELEYELDGEWVLYGSLYDLLFESYFYFKYGFDCTLPPLGATTTAAVTTEATTEASTTTAAATTTTPFQPGNCDQRSILINISNNHTILFDSITVAYNSWNVTVQNRWKPYINQASNAVWNSSISTTQKCYNASNIFFKATTASSGFQAIMLNVVIEVNSFVWGTVRQFCACDGFSN